MQNYMFYPTTNIQCILNTTIKKFIWKKLNSRNEKNKSFYNKTLVKIRKANTTIALIKKYYQECKIDYI